MSATEPVTSQAAATATAAPASLPKVAATSATGILRGSLPIAVGAAGVALTILICFGAWRVLALGGIGQGLALLDGRHLYVAQPTVDVGEVAVGETVTVEFRLQNLSSESLTVDGAKTDCSCTTTSGLPLTMAALESGTIQVHLKPSARDVGDAIDRTVELVCDHSSETVPIQLRATVTNGG